MQLRYASGEEIRSMDDHEGMHQLLEREAAQRFYDNMPESDMKALERLHDAVWQEDNFAMEPRHQEYKPAESRQAEFMDYVDDCGQVFSTAKDKIMATLLHDWTHEEITEMVQNLPPENGRLPLEVFFAFYANDIEFILDWLESSNYDVDALGSGLGQVTLLFGSCQTQRLEFTSFLLQKGANTEIVNIVGHTALGNELFCHNELSDSARLLLTWGATIPAISDFSTYFKEELVVAGWKLMRESTLLKSEFGGRRCELINLNQRADLMGKTCVVTKYLPRKNRYKIKMEHSDESFLVGRDNLKRRDRTPDDPGYYINYQNGEPICYEFTSNEECQAFVRYIRARSNNCWG